jgi:hypothetical protein
MLSIIVCSRHKILDKQFVENIKYTVGVDYEIVPIDNSENRYTIFSAYNVGSAQSKYPYLCFVHEDVLFHTQNWGENVINHLQDIQTGIIGIAGSDLLPRVPTSWATLKTVGHNIIQSHNAGKEPSEYIFKPEGYKLSKRSTISIDGVFMCMRKDLMEKIQFDENLNGFHGYDYDITIQSIVAGYKNYVIYDITIEHFSGGRTDILYFRNLIKIFKKWEKFLPLICNELTESDIAQIPDLEKRKLYQLTKKMCRKGFSIKEIETEISYFSQLIGYPKAAYCLPVRIFLIRLFNAPKYLFRS